MEKRITSSAEETTQAGISLASSLSGGDIVALYGDLGSGKTTFVQGIAKGLGITQRIVSPTFIILKTHTVDNKSDLDTFYHADLYRIETAKDIESIGLKEIFTDKNAILVMEWPEKIEEILPKHTKKIRFSYISDTDRQIIYE